MTRSLPRQEGDEWREGQHAARYSTVGSRNPFTRLCSSEEVRLRLFTPSVSLPCLTGEIRHLERDGGLGRREIGVLLHFNPFRTAVPF